MNARLLSLAFFVLFAVAALARAETNFGECIEWAVADSDRVFIGKIVNVEKRSHEIVTVEVTKTLRGKHEAKVTFAIRAYAIAYGQNWQKAGVPILFCLVNRDRIKDKDLADLDVLRWGITSAPSAYYLGKTDQPPTDVFTRDFRDMTDSAAIVKHVEAYVKTIPADWKRRHVTVDLPFDAPAHKKLYGGSAVYFALPADSVLEADGRRWCKSKNPDERSRGVRALEAFRNEENIKILKGLLSDGAFSTGSGKKSYYIRVRAYNVLQEFAVEVPRPVLEEPAK